MEFNSHNILNASADILSFTKAENLSNSTQISFLQTLKETFNAGDEEVRTWFLIRHNFLPFFLCGCYALFAKIIGPAIMRNRKPFELRKPMIVFNLCLVVTYVTMLTIIFIYLPKIGKTTFCKGAPVKKGELTYLLTRCGWILYLLKYIEFFDTVFFVLRKKNNLITFLHVFHHTLVPIMAWIILRTERNGLQAIPAIFNSCVHVVMYTYYGLAAVGPQMKKYLWWKKYLTQLQIIQFIFILLFVTVIAPLSGCSMLKTSIYLDLFGGTAFLILFYNFYRQSFQSKTIKEE